MSKIWPNKKKLAVISEMNLNIKYLVNQANLSNIVIKVVIIVLVLPHLLAPHLPLEENSRDALTTFSPESTST